MAEAIKVAVRVRPFNGREQERNAKLIIKMVGNTTYISNPDEPDAEPRKFTFDYSYWSHDGFDTQANGVLVPSQGSSKYADQQRVFDDLGRGVLANAFAGFNTSLFAYGQTGSGKSYSIVGYGSNRGIVPMVCDTLFSTIEENKKAGGGKVGYQVTLSMLEIYNEQVRDLLCSDHSMKGLPVRQNTELNKFYVQGLKKLTVSSYSEIERRIAEGTANRTLAATKMNATSSRAHTVVTILFEQIQKNEEGKEQTKSSEINLVDLAGSERAASTGATGDTLKEGSMINKSLSCLANVIAALAELCTNKKSKIVVPYRDSVLTKLLQNSLGGNSKTIMIAALSPADINYEETLSTLRYADRAKQIKTIATVNESDTDKLIRTLKEENERLKKMLDGGSAPPAAATTTTAGTPAPGALSEEDRLAMRKQLEDEIRAQMEENMRAIQADENRQAHPEGPVVSAEEQQREKEAQLHKKKLTTVAHITNLNEDPLLCGLVVHFLEKPTNIIGKSEPNDTAPPEIALNGLSIRKGHAIITSSSSSAGKYFLKPGNELSKTLLNGAPLTAETELHHNDRILFGSNHLYVFVNPAYASAKSPGTPDSVTWEFAQNEIAKAKGFHTDHSGLSADQLRVQEQVLELLPLIAEANAISEEMTKHRIFEIALMSGIARGERGKDVATQVLVKMKNGLNGNEWFWPREKFIDRRFLFQSQYQEWTENEDSSLKSKLIGPPRSGDPFYEPPEDVLVGTANAFLQSLSYALDFEDTLTIVDYRGEEQGRVRIVAAPCDAQGRALGDDVIIDEPSELLEKEYHFTVTIASVDINKARYSKGITCKYNMFGMQQPISTPVQRGLSIAFNYTKQFDFKKVKPDLLDWFESGCLTMHFYATQEESDDVALARTTRRLSQSDRNGSNASQAPPMFAMSSSSAAPTISEHTELTLKSSSSGVSSLPQQSTAAAAAAAAAASNAAEIDALNAQVSTLTTRITFLEQELDQARRVTPPPPAAPTLVPGSDKLTARIDELEREVAQADVKYTAREKKLQQLLDSWYARPPTEQTFSGLHSAISHLVNMPDRFRRSTIAATTTTATNAANSEGGVATTTTTAAAPTIAPIPASSASAAANAHTNSSTTNSSPPHSAHGGPPASKACSIQ